MRSTIKLAMGCLFALAATLAAHDARSDGAAPRHVTPNSDGAGITSVYGEIPADQIEALSTPDAIKRAVLNGGPTLVWATLEHGEKVDCLDCIGLVAPLLYDSNAKNREIAAWWLRRRIFGVFGPGEVYEQTVKTLQGDANPVRRAYAAYALGEFLQAPGIVACAAAVTGDADARVRAAAASALGRLNDDGAGALAKAMSDGDAGVKIAALGAAGQINSFSGVSNVASLTIDASSDVRRRAIEVLDALRAKDTIAAVAAAAQGDADAGVRAVACHALGVFGDASARAILTNLSQSDPDTFVRDQAGIALRRL
jgi:HEAT repeat protein